MPFQPKVNISPSQGWTVQPKGTPPTPKAAPKIVNNITGSFNMSQRDAEQAALDGAYHNTKMYGAPPKGK